MNAASIAWVAAGSGLASGCFAIRGRRRRRALNACMHELRRPLQALALERAPSRGGGRLDSLDLAIAALDDLDRRINDRDPRPGSRRALVDVEDLVSAAAIRWRLRGAGLGRLIRVRWSAGPMRMRIDPVRASQAIDNLIANAFEHGHGPIVIEGVRRDGRLEVAIRDGSRRAVTRFRAAADPRHGHGLRLSRELASQDGGELRIRRAPGQTTASLSFPLAGLRAPADAPAPARR